MDRHATFHRVLEAIKEAKECWLCNLEEKATHAYLEAILYEAVNDAKVRAELIRSRGYCHRHAHYLVGLRDSLGVATLYQDQVNLFLKSLDKMDSGSKSKPGTTGELQPCPACQNQKEARDRYILTFLEGLAESEIKAAFESSPGLCIPHFFIISEAAKETATRQYLQDMERKSLEMLLQELQEFCRKHDYRYSDEPYGKESDSWIRAIKKLTGSKDNF